MTTEGRPEITLLAPLLSCSAVSVMAAEDRDTDIPVLCRSFTVFGALRPGNVRVGQTHAFPGLSRAVSAPAAPHPALCDAPVMTRAEGVLSVTATPTLARRGGNDAEATRRAELEKALTARDGNRRCFYCGGPSSPIDHVTAKSRGGSDLIDNLVFACKTCNLLKGNCPGWFYVIWLWARRGVVRATVSSDAGLFLPPFRDSELAERPGSQRSEDAPC